MRVARAIAVAVVGATLVFGLSGCSFSPPPITDEQLAGWKALAAQTIPAATDVTMEVKSATTMAGPGRWIEITAVFANYEDVKASEQALAEFDRTVTKQSRGLVVNTSAVNASAAAHAAGVGAALVREVPGLASATAVESAYRYQGDSRWVISTNFELYVVDPSALDPAWLDQMVMSTEASLAEVGGGPAGMWIFPADKVGVDFSDFSFRDALIHVKDLKGFADAGASKGCVRTQSWAYDVSGDYVAPYPAAEPDGACA